MLVTFVFSLMLAFQSEDSETAAELFRNIWSPYCPGISLMECPSLEAQELRDQLRSRLKNGEAPEALTKEMYGKFGTRLRMSPKTSGRESLAYWLPWCAWIFSTILVLFFWKKRRSKLPPPHPPTPFSAELETKIQRDLS